MKVMTMPSEGTVEKELLDFLHLRTKTVWEEDTDLFAAGGLSSLFAMELVVHLEKSYGIAIRGADLRLDNFRTVTGMAALVRRLRAAAGDGGE
ncbi:MULTISPECIES: acyl carrier protein [Streptomyces]|nr:MULTISPECIES: acyl carrier protein [Streptomyces]MDX2522128.1 acyl carrier protein [Streptomyces stelliscabiei]MDX2553492.1 acyl carrier protein [Streptomyces stelliscabiei]MDX2612528.1 acyl carrier protein [Streptomyces stelliscabiei]MDX2637598.1 acyl carrier protein [Streptomyces stelliscabiei]MDX2663726.1 acyl carrier protein [Streptomyces stelliscabiei]